MLRYIITQDPVYPKFLQVITEIELLTEVDSFDLALPIWRPGRYETQTFSRNIQFIKFFDEEFKPIRVKKTENNIWRINSKGKIFWVVYRYYANTLDAGNGCYVDASKLYINPATCLFFLPEYKDEKIEIYLGNSNNHKIATSLKPKSTTKSQNQAIEAVWKKLTELCHSKKITKTKNSWKNLIAKNYDELADSPILISEKLDYRTLTIKDYHFHIWFDIDGKVKWERVLRDFKKMIEAQIKFFGSFPVLNYHFLFLILPNRIYHGVEHLRSCVIALGPDYKIFNSDYDFLLEFSSHELFHAWNVKYFRPVEIGYYDFLRPQLTTMHWLTEGGTTYYQELFLARSGVYTEDKFLQKISSELQIYLDYYEGNSQSVAEASFDSWLDGYTPSIPDRKVSFYLKGKFINFILDTWIRRDTDNRKSLDSVFIILNERAQNNFNSYSEEDFQEIIKKLTKKDYTNFFRDYVDFNILIKPELEESFKYYGLEIQEKPNSNIFEKDCGLKIAIKDKKLIVKKLAQNSPVRDYGLLEESQILYLNNREVNYSNISEIYDFFNTPKIDLTINTESGINNLSIPKKSANFFPQYYIIKSKKQTPNQKKNRLKWLNTTS